MSLSPRDYLLAADILEKGRAAMNYIVEVKKDEEIWARFGVFSSAVADEIAARITKAATEAKERAVAAGAEEFAVPVVYVRVIGLDGFDDDTSISSLVEELEADL